MSTLPGQGAPLIMGILNATPDSFSDGGRYCDPKRAVAHARDMLRQGADIIDIGGESSRPGAERVSPQEQMRRTLDIIAACRAELPGAIPISIDTSRAGVAEQALDCGATMINDITAGGDDPGILTLAAERNVPICLMHMQGRPQTMQDAPHYEDVIGEVRHYLLQRAETALAAGVAREHIILDPGIGFGKTSRHNLQLLAGLPQLVATGYPILLGTSRKGFLASHSRSETPDGRLHAGCATTVWGVASGVRIFRVHDVLAHRESADTAWAIRGETAQPLQEPGDG